MDILEIRRLFPMLQQTVNGHPFVYLDSAATSLKPDSVVDAIVDFYKNEYGTVHRAVYATAAAATDCYEGSRVKIARFINADSDEIVFTRGATAAINLAAHSMGEMCLQEGDEIIITEMEHHSNIVPWQMVQARFKAQLKVVPFLDNGELDLQAYKKLLSSRTKIVAITHMSNTLGTINPIKEMIALAHGVSAKVLIDAAQSIAHIPIDVQDLNVDFLVFSGHKMYGPTGIGVLFGKKRWLEEMPPFEGGGDMIETVTFEQTTYNIPPMKFEAGTPIIAGVIGLGAAVDFISTIGIDAIRTHEDKLYQYLVEQLRSIPQVTILGQAVHKGPLATFVTRDIHPLDIATMVDLEGVAIRSGHLCAQPTMRHFRIPAAARISLACYNTLADIDCFAAALKKTIMSCAS